MMNQVANSDSTYRSLYKIGGAAALIAAVLILGDDLPGPSREWLCLSRELAAKSARFCFPRWFSTNPQNPVEAGNLNSH